MPRRASSSVPYVWILVGIVVVVAGVAGVYYLYNSVSDPYRTLAPLDVKAYMENSNSLRGNVYKLAGTISNQLAWSPADGRLFSVDADADFGGDPVPLLVPPQFNHVNIQKGQRFLFEIEVVDKGILKTKDLKKV